MVMRRYCARWRARCFGLCRSVSTHPSAPLQRLHGLLVGSSRLGHMVAGAITLRRTRRLEGFDVRVQEPANHALVLHAAFFRLGLAEEDASRAQRDRDLERVFLEYQSLGRRKKIGNDAPDLHGFIGIANFLFHKWPFPFSRSRRR